MGGEEGPVQGGKEARRMHRFGTEKAAGLCHSKLNYRLKGYWEDGCEMGGRESPHVVCGYLLLERQRLWRVGLRRFTWAIL